MARYVMIIDTKRCIGCHTCAMACKQENNLPNGVWWNQVFTGEISDFTGDRSKFTYGKAMTDVHLKIDVAQGDPLTGGLVNSPSEKKITMGYYTKACQHCSKPLCKDACPADAVIVDPVTGVVDTDFSKCIGCDNCITACPYDVRHHNNNESQYTANIGGQGINKHKDNTVGKCTFCSHRLGKGETPACVESCLAAARYFGNANDPFSHVYSIIKTRHPKQLLPDAGTEPSIYFLT